MSVKRTRSSALCRKPVIAGLLLGVFLFVLALTHSWALHHAFCSEAAAPGHKCAVTLLTAGQVLVPASTVSVITTPGFVAVCEPAEPLHLTVADYSLLRSRGPPASLT
jgi:hypothetical protein